MHRTFLALLIAGPVAGILPGSCAPAPVPQSPQQPAASGTAPPGVAPSSSSTGVVATEAGASVAASAQPPSPPPAEVAPPCIDGELLMGACICSKGKGVDATGHCVFMPCPPSTSGGSVFRDESTGQCMECRPGSKPSGDGKCVR